MPACALVPADWTARPLTASCHPRLRPLCGSSSVARSAPLASVRRKVAPRRGSIASTTPPTARTRGWASATATSCPSYFPMRARIARYAPLTIGSPRTLTSELYSFEPPTSLACLRVCGSPKTQPSPTRSSDIGRPSPRTPTPTRTPTRAISTAVLPPHDRIGLTSPRAACFIRLCSTRRTPTSRLAGRRSTAKWSRRRSRSASRYDSRRHVSRRRATAPTWGRRRHQLHGAKMSWRCEVLCRVRCGALFYTSRANRFSNFY